ncbi:PD-(D/E)XK nuclease family protein [Caballeronia sp. SBC2]|uniref:PDDEXK-like family protein n=1 Tax=Caballeronia sp. SBC2 TaxID=2705547 RepID=UPI0013E16314|nr:PD-(D/E)XK nuclease family protein [Caballeronia sp. SBC2]QIE30352.1 PD-(D/E)XK nuclease superfamily protein [Caballeronia sp. SBC2]
MSDSNFDKVLQLLYDERAIALRARWRAFNPFRVLRADRYEIRHTNTLAWLLNPTENHGMGDVFLRGFLKAVREATDDSEAQFRYETDAHSAIRVRREVLMSALNQAGLGTDGESVEEGQPVKRDGRLDVLIDGDRWAIAVEAKIDSNEGAGQLAHYHEHLRAWAAETGKHLISIYLTLAFDDDAETSVVSLANGGADEFDDSSSGNSRSNRSNWVNVTWNTTVATPLRTAMHAWNSAGALTDAQQHFMASYLDILDELSPGSDTPISKTLAGLAEDHTDALRLLKNANVATRTNNGGTQVPWAALLEHNKDLFVPLLNLVQSDVAERADEIRSALVKENTCVGDLKVVEGNNSWIRFIPARWKQQYPWIYELADPDLPRVVFEIANTPTKLTIKLMVCHLGEQGFRHEKHWALRRAMVEAIQTNSRNKTVCNRAFNKRGEPVPMSAVVFTIASRIFTWSEDGRPDLLAFFAELDAFIGLAANALEPYLNAATQVATGNIELRVQGGKTDIPVSGGSSTTPFAVEGGADAAYIASRIASLAEKPRPSTEDLAQTN